MVWGNIPVSGWTTLINNAASSPLPAEDPEDLESIRKPTTIPTVKVRKDRNTEFIDRDLVERILKDDNGIELRWLQEILEDGVRILNGTGRYLKSEPFLSRIRQQRRKVDQKHESL